MLKVIKKKIILICLLVFIVAMPGCRKKIEREAGWINGRYDLITNISRAELDKIGFDLGTHSNRRILHKGWSEDKKSIDGRNYVLARGETSIIKLPPLNSSPKILVFQAFPLLPAGVSAASVSIQLNGHLLKKVKLLPEWKTYSITIKGRYFSLEGNTLTLKHSYYYSKKDKSKGQRGKKPSVAYDKIYLVRKDLAHKAGELPSNFIRATRMIVAGDNRMVLQNKANYRFSHQLSLSYPAELHFSLGLPKAIVEDIKEIEFRILAKKRTGEEQLLFSKKYQSDKAKLYQYWNDFKVNLTHLKDSKISLAFENRITPRKNSPLSYDYIFWGNPFIVNSQREQNKKSNIIIYLVDTLRADHLSCYGNPIIKTPYIDKVASQGVIFQKAFTQCSWTKPSVASLFTATYPSYHGVITKRDALTKQITTLAEALRENGYFTAAFVNNPHLASAHDFYQGFDTYVVTYHQLKQRPLYSNHMNELILPWLENKADTPFFLYIHTLDPHLPYTPPPPFDTMYDKNYQGSLDGSYESMDKFFGGKFNARDLQHLETLYDGEISLNDAAFGELIEKLEKLQIYDQSLIVFTSDHGEELYEHKMFGHGQSLYEDQIHIPLIMRCAPWLPHGKKISSMVRSIDIMPTVLELLDIPIPQQCQGKSLIPLIDGKEKSVTNEVYCEKDFKGKSLQSIRRKKWKLIFHPKRNSLMLFDLQKDPEEIHNLANQYPELADALLKKLIYWHQEQIALRAGIPRAEAKKLSPETIKQLKALGYIN